MVNNNLPYVKRNKNLDINTMSNQIGNLSNKAQGVLNIEEYINLVPSRNTISDTTQWDWTAAWNQAINDLKASTSGFRTLFLGGRNYKITTNTVIDFPLSLQGLYNGRKYGSDNGGTKIVDAYTGSSAFIRYQPAVGAIAGRMWGGLRINDIHIDGQNASHRCIEMVNTAWEMMINCLYIENYQGSALYCDTVYDSNVYGLTIVNCGGLNIGGVIDYALTLDSTVSDCTNAMHFFGMHIEKCRYAIKFGKARHNQFIGSKVEAFETYTISSDLTNPYIWVDSSSLENQFIGSMFVPPRAEDWLTLGYATLITQVPYFIAGMGSVQASASYQSVIIDSCTVTNPPGKAVVSGTPTGVSGGGSRFIASGTTVKACFKISNCHIDDLHGGDYGIYLLGGSSITNCKIGVQVDANGKCYGIRVDNSKAIGNDITSVFRSGVTVTADTAILGANASLIGDNDCIGFTTKVLGDGVTTNLRYRRRNNVLKVNETLFMSLHGLGSIDYTNVAPNMSKFDTSHLAFELNSSFTIKNITNGQDSDQIIIHNNKGGTTITLVHGDTSGTNSKLVLKGNANVTLNPEEFIVLKFAGWQWMEVSRRTNT